MRRRAHSVGCLGWVGALWIAASLVAAVASAHEVRPGYLEMRELASDRWSVLWKVPARGDRRLGLTLELPATCERDEGLSWMAGGAYLERFEMQCPGGLLGSEIVIAGLEGTRTDVVARVEPQGGTTQTARLTPDAAAFTVTGAAGWVEVAMTYTVLGFEHILLGPDHLLFVLALLFLVGNGRRLVGTITAFTLAHSLTLAAATLGWVHVPPPPVEAVIALSILFTAVELAHSRDRQGLAQRRPWLVALSFGLLHGFGFAGALSEVGLPEHAIPAALLFFNVGVELGQLVFVAGVVAALAVAARVWTGASAPWPVANRIARPAAYAIGIPAAYWCLERTAAFWRS
ncbi:MAG: HupE/UreJ family protein [Myxococcales bacterium]|nr:HupE/UreJ family protein [Myxococcales bacterium]